MKYTGSIKDMRSCMWLRNHIKISCCFSIFFLGKNIITYLYICAFCHCFHCHCYRHICYYCHWRNHVKISCRFSIFFLERTVEYEQCLLYSKLGGSWWHYSQAAGFHSGTYQRSIDSWTAWNALVWVRISWKDIWDKTTLAMLPVRLWWSFRHLHINKVKP